MSKTQSLLKGFTSASKSIKILRPALLIAYHPIRRSLGAWPKFHFYAWEAKITVTLITAKNLYHGGGGGAGAKDTLIATKNLSYGIGSWEKTTIILFTTKKISLLAMREVLGAKATTINIAIKNLSYEKGIGTKATATLIEIQTSSSKVGMLQTKALSATLLATNNDCLADSG